MSVTEEAHKQVNAETRLEEEAVNTALQAVKIPPMAARVGEGIFVLLHPLPIPTVLTPITPPCTNVLIGNRPAWRGLPAAAAAELAKAKQRSQQAVNEAKVARMVATGTAGQGAAEVHEEETKVDEKRKMAELILKAAAMGTDTHGCVHGPGVVNTGSKTVLINGLPACRQGDRITEASGPDNGILTGEPTVWIGG